jgi:hypothetical protein
MNYKTRTSRLFLREACLPKRKPAQLQAGIVVESPEFLFCPPFLIVIGTSLLNLTKKK